MDTHLVFGATGVAGAGITRHLAEATADPVFAASRSGRADGRARGVAVDLRDRARVAEVVREVAPTVVYYAAEMHGAGGGDVHPRHAQLALRLLGPVARTLGRVPAVGERLFGEVNRQAGLVDDGTNAAMFDHVLAALSGAPVRHVALLTGVRWSGVHLGPLWSGYPAVLRADDPRHPGPSWYEALERGLQGASGGFTRSIHRPNFVLGAGAPHSLVNALGGYAVTCRAAGVPLRFLGGRAMFERGSEAVDAEGIGAQMVWATGRTGVHLTGFADRWRWSEVWPHLARRYGIGWDVPERPAAVHEVVPDPERAWADARSRAGLPPLPLAEAFPVLFLHQTMVMNWEVAFDPDRWPAPGSPLAALDRCLERLEARGLLPAA